MGIAQQGAEQDTPELKRTVAKRSNNEFTDNGQWWDDSRLSDDNVATRDADLYHAAEMQRYINGDQSYRGDAQAWAGGLNTDVVKASINALRARSAQRQGLKDDLMRLPGMQNEEEGLLKREAATAVGQGVKNTRQNFNQRGMLYSGLREGGEERVRGAGAAQLSGAISSARRDYANQEDATKHAIAAMGLASQQQELERKEKVFETSMKNSVARMQAFQQLGGGIGAVAGMYYGATRPTPQQMDFSNEPMRISASGNAQAIGRLDAPSPYGDRLMEY